MPPKKSRSGPNIDEAQRHTSRINVRLPRELAEAIADDGERYDLTIGQVLSAYRDLAVASGRLPKALFAAMVREERSLDYDAVVGFPIGTQEEP